MVGRGHVWEWGVHGRGACVAGGMFSGGVHGSGHAWQVEACVVGGMHGVGGVHGRGACMAGGMHGGGYVWQQVCVVGGGDMHGRGIHDRGTCMVGETATAADGTHPTGMHSCLL